jgi:type I restriction enzyme, S subunit
MENNFPETWDLLPLEDCMEAIIDYRGKTPHKSSFGIPLITAKIVKGGRILEPTEFIPYEDYDERMQRGIPNAGDVVVTTEAPLGEVGQLDNRKLSVGQRLITLRGKSDLLDNTYLKFLMMSDFVQNQLLARATGTTVIGIKQTELRKIDLVVPPLSEQRAIAGLLGALDGKIEVNRRMNATLESMARTVFHQWFVENREVGDWETAVLNDLAESILGGDWGKDTNEDGTLLPAYCIRGADIPDLQAGGTGKMPLRYIKSSSLEKRKLQAGDIVVEISGGSPTQSTGRPVFISDTLLNRLQHPLVASNFCRVFRPKDTIVSNFVYFWLRFLYSRDEFFQYENGTTGIKNFAFTIFCEQYYLSVPPKAMLEKYHQFTKIIFETMQRNAKESRTLGSLRDSLLPKLMRGEVRVKDVEGV